MKDELIKNLVLLNDNETVTLSRGCQDYFRRIIVELLRIKYGVRYHEYNRECQCQPECKIKSLLEDSELKEFLKKHRVLEDIKKLLDDPINKDVTVWGESDD